MKIIALVNTSTIQYVEDIRYTGNWSYDEESNELFIVTFERIIVSHTKNGEDYEEPWNHIYVTGTAFEGVVEILNSSELVLKREILSSSFDEESLITSSVETSYIYFEK